MSKFILFRYDERSGCRFVDRPRIERRMGGTEKWLVVGGAKCRDMYGHRTPFRRLVRAPADTDDAVLWDMAAHR